MAYNQWVLADPTQLIDARTRFCAVFGHPIKHSASPAMQNAGIAALNLNWRYLAFDVHPENLRAAIDGAKAMKFIGLNLTVPHKILAMEMVDVLDESAKTWGAVNTIRFEASVDGQWVPLDQCQEVNQIRSRGFNTDADAVIRSIREDCTAELRGIKTFLLGAGGAGRVVALKLAAEEVSHLYLVNRTISKAEEIASEIRERFPQVKVSVGYPREPIDLLVNATSLGLQKADPLPFDPQLFSLGSARAVYDLIYRPAETPLLELANAAGCKTANGLGMLLHQGTKALELWSGRTAPIETMRAALSKNVYG